MDAMRKRLFRSTSPISPIGEGAPLIPARRQAANNGSFISTTIPQRFNDRARYARPSGPAKL
jgi:hypothetical protein